MIVILFNISANYGYVFGVDILKAFLLKRNDWFHSLRFARFGLLLCDADVCEACSFPPGTWVRGGWLLHCSPRFPAVLFVPFWEQKPFGLGILVGPGRRNASTGICWGNNDRFLKSPLWLIATFITTTMRKEVNTVEDCMKKRCVWRLYFFSGWTVPMSSAKTDCNTHNDH